MKYNVVIVGGGPAGLSAALRLKQLDPQLSICLLEKGSQIGAHLLSGAVLDPRSLKELCPNWEEAPLGTPVEKDTFKFLTRSKSFTLPTPYHNHGNSIISLGALCQWLGSQAEAQGVEIYAGFTATGLLGEERICGVRTGDRGLQADGTPGPQYEPGIEIEADHVLLAEGCRGFLTEKIINKWGLRSEPQTYGIGIKEIWEIDPRLHQKGLVVHTLGWPLDHHTYGGGFMYHYGENLVSLGLVVGLDYKDPSLSPFQEFQQWKHHPLISSCLEGGKPIGYGARALNEGGFQSIPTLSFPGGSLMGCGAGFLNVPRIKGIHGAMKSGILAAEGCFDALKKGKDTYRERFEASWLREELYKARNIRPSFQKGLIPGLLYSALESYLFKGHTPWTFKHHKDHLQLKPMGEKKSYPAVDGKISFDIPSSLYLSGTNHRDNQPCHLKLKKSFDASVYGAPETFYCPAGVYEKDGENLRINSQNCLHCKTCDIKDPRENIEWTPPEGGDGPHYQNF